MATDSEARRAKARDALTNQPYKTVTVLSSLLSVHDALSYLPTEALEEVAEYTGSTVNDVWGIASFYTNFRFTPPEEHTIEICWGPSCYVKGAMPIIDTIANSLGLSNEGESDAQRCSFRLNTCLGACSQAPVVSVDHEIIGNFTPEQSETLIDELGNNPRRNGGD